MVNRCLVTSEGGKTSKPYPAVHNLIFLQVDRSIEELKKVLKECPYALSVYCRAGKPDTWCLIPDNEIMDLRLMCDTSFTEPLFITQKESELKLGTQVIVTHGPLKGIRGKLVRKNKKYYLVKTLAGLGVMVAVSRWCCKSTEVNEEKVKRENLQSTGKNTSLNK